jgi:hexosaminidase
VHTSGSNTRSRRRLAAGLTIAGLTLGLGSFFAASAQASGARPALADCTTTATGEYPPSSATIGLQTSEDSPGEANIVSASGFEPDGGQVQLTFCSTPVSLGTATINADGDISQAVTIPSDAALGRHMIMASGPNSDGGTLRISIDLTVVAPAGTTTSSNGSLPFTGLDLIPLIVSALTLIAVGTGLVLVGRDRLRNRSAA